MQQMIKNYTNGQTATAALIHQKLQPIMKELFKAPNPAPVKTALQLKVMSDLCVFLLSR